MAHPDFRVNGKIFATFGYPDDRWCMVKLPPALQRSAVENNPIIFKPANGAWGRRGSTLVLLAKTNTVTLKPLIYEAWQLVSGKPQKRS